MWRPPCFSPSQAWPLVWAHTCTRGYINTALQLGLSPQGWPHHGALAHPGLGPVLLHRGSLGCHRKYQGWVCSLRLKVFSFCHLSLGLGDLLLPGCSRGHCRTPAQAQLQWHPGALHKGPRARMGRAGCECVAMWEGRVMKDRAMDFLSSMVPPVAGCGAHRGRICGR